MRVDFPRWEEGDLISWISRAEHYFRFHQTTNAAMVEITAINLKGDAIQWFNWFEHTHRAEDMRSEGATTIHSDSDYLLRAATRRTLEP
ncbi:hypothetical protein B296_00020001 [Ensete ventricosum]|uniref:Retrotransposon gag domain-containing protein n=1 Tax=Ensete ventricosum TaxID=4639 RepID=A0A426ZCI9_ENSVE|nr:hypothetical protein B296_00020001 [Ensete ventricosum]